MNEDWQKKLENISLPEIELASHRQSLRRALLLSPRFQPKPDIFWVKRWAPVGVALVLVLFFASQAIYAKVQESRAMGIARDDSEIQKLGLDFAKVKMVAKPTVLPLSEPSASFELSALSVIASSTSSSSSPSPAAETARSAKEDKIMSVEIDDGESKYLVFVNMTRKKVERIKKEGDSKDKKRGPATSTQAVERPDQNKNNQESRLNERWQAPHLSATPSISPARKGENKKED